MSTDKQKFFRVKRNDINVVSTIRNFYKPDHPLCFWYETPAAYEIWYEGTPKKRVLRLPKKRVFKVYLHGWPEME